MSYAKISSVGARGGDRFTVADHVDHLLEIEVMDVKEMATQMGPTRAAVVNVRDLTDGTDFEDQLIFQSILVSSLAPAMGQKVLAYLRMGIASPGKSAPYLLIDASEDEDALKAAGAAQGDTAGTGPVSSAPGEVDAAVEALGGLLA